MKSDTGKPAGLDLLTSGSSGEHLPDALRALARPEERSMPPASGEVRSLAASPRSSRRFPPLIALSYFEVAARTKSFAAAAKELHVTPAAVSHQIKALEEHIGVELFVRHSKKVSLSAAALAALPALNEGFASLVEAVERMRAHSEAKWTVTVCAEPLLATKWLVPRLHRFYAMWPEAEVRLQASLGSVDTVHSGALTESSFRRASLDLSIRFGLGSYPGLEAHELMQVNLVPVCSSSLADRLPFDTPDQLLSKPLLSDSSPYRGAERFGWTEWFAAFDLGNPKPSRVRSYSNGLLGLETALTGQGILLGIDRIVRPEIKVGKLAVAYHHQIKCPYGYHIVCPTAALDREIVQRFRRWLIDEAVAGE
jgi:LysR family glycine cleavage system transcriptional activator